MMQHNPVDDRIRELYRQNGGVITPDIVIEDAKDPASPLHEEFNWDVEAVALKAWREKARHLIRRVRVIVETEDIVFKGKGHREFISDPGKARNEQGYISRAELRTDRDRAMDAMRAEVERIEAAIRRAQEVAEDIGLSDEVEIVNESVVRLKNKLNAA